MMGTIKADKTNSFCSFPWTGAQIHVSGQIRPCCMMNDLGIHYRKGVKVQEVMKTPNMVLIQETLLSGGRPKECHACYEEDQLGINSVRMYSPPLPKKVSPGSIQPLHRAEISFTNACNLDCAMCRPEFSTQVALAQKKFFEERGTPQLFKQPKIFNISEDDVESLVEQFASAKECRLIGGEPLMTKAGRKFIRLWADQQLPGQLDIATNGTFLDDELIADLARCKKIILNVSVDGTGSTYEWIRGTSWESVKEKLIKANDQVRMKLTTTVQAYNLFNLPDLSQFCEKNKIRLRLGHILRHPYHLSVLLWPLSVRLRCAENYKELWGEDHEDLINILRLNQTISGELYNDFFEWTSFMNRQRGFTWESTDPRIDSFFPKPMRVEPQRPPEAHV